MNKTMRTAVLTIVAFAFAVGSASLADDASPYSTREVWRRVVSKRNKQRPEYAFVEPDGKLPNVLLIGDSISMSYTVGVRERMAGVANVYRAPDNCRSTRQTLAEIESYLGDIEWDVIHFNWGIHDITHLNEDGKVAPPPDGQHQVPLDQYTRNVHALVERLTKTGAKLVWASTTPIGQKTESKGYRRDRDVVAYNAAVAEVMQTDQIAINDLYSLVKPRSERLLNDGVHFTGLGQMVLAEAVAGAVRERLPDKGLDYAVELTTVTSGWDGKKCWVHSRAGAIPPRSPGNPSDTPIVVMTTQKLRITGSDIFDGLRDFRTDDLGSRWTGPVPHAALDRRPMGENIEAAPCDFTPQWHARTGKLLGTGKTFWYKDDEHFRGPPSDAVYSVYDSGKRIWSPWARVDLPDLPQFKNCSAGCAQRFDLPNGDVLLPVYFRPTPTNVHHRVTVVRCKFDGTTLSYAGHGDEIEIPDQDGKHRGLAEPSLTRFKNRFYLTLRSDHRGYVATSEDGMSFTKPKRWRFDDGRELGSYNTQQHWVTHSEGLFLTYTRRGADNNHVFRHRAPVFMARVDAERLVVIRDTERIIIPETGTRMGNFGIVDVSPAESWVITTEWMQPHRPELWKKYGTDNRIFCARILWSNPHQRTP